MYVTKHVNTTTINSFILKLYIPHNHKAATTLSLSPTHLGHYIQHCHSVPHTWDTIYNTVTQSHTPGTLYTTSRENIISPN